MALAGEENARADLGAQQEILFRIRKVESFCHDIDRCRRLLQEELYRRIRDDGTAVRRPQKILDVLGDRGDAEIIFPGPLHEAEEEGRRIVVFHHDPGFIDKEESLCEFRAD